MNWFKELSDDIQGLIIIAVAVTVIVCCFAVHGCPKTDQDNKREHELKLWKLKVDAGYKE